MFATMNRAQRIIVVIYFLAVTYCCIWLPWISTTQLSAGKLIEISYSFVWAAPNCYCRADNGIAPDMQLIFLRIIAVTSVAAGAFTAAGALRSAKRN